MTGFNLYNVGIFPSSNYILNATFSKQSMRSKINSQNIMDKPSTSNRVLDLLAITFSKHS